MLLFDELVKMDIFKIIVYIIYDHLLVYYNKS